MPDSATVPSSESVLGSRNTSGSASSEAGQAGTHRLAERNLIQVILRHGIFGSDPGGRLFRTVVFEPAVGVGDFGAEVVIHDFRTLGIGIRQVFDFHR